MSWCGSLWVYLVWDPRCFPYLDVYFFSQSRKVFVHYLFREILCLLSSFSDPYNTNITHLMLSQSSFKLLLKNCSDWVPFTLPSYRLLICSVLSSVLLIPSHYFLFQLLNSSIVISFLMKTNNDILMMTSN